MGVELFNVMLGIFSKYIASFKKIEKTFPNVFIVSNFLLTLPHIEFFCLSDYYIKHKNNLCI